MLLKRISILALLFCMLGALLVGAFLPTLVAAQEIEEMPEKENTAMHPHATPKHAQGQVRPTERKRGQGAHEEPAKGHG